MKIKKGIINGIIFIIFVILTFYVLLKDHDIFQILEIMKQVDKRWIVLAIVCMCCFVIAEGVNIARSLKLMHCQISFRNGIRYAFVGFFFSSVTPGASGGDPMQLYEMKKDGLPMGQSALAILAEFSSFQLVTVIMAVVGFITNYSFIQESVGHVKYLLILGVAINGGILGIILLTIFSKKMILKLVNWVCQILRKCHYQKVKVFRKTCFKQIKEYKRGANLLMKNPNVLCQIVGTTICQIVLYHSIPYWIYLAFGLQGGSFWQFLALQSVLYLSVSSLPLPGAVGVSEGGFLGVYRRLFPTELLNSAMLLSRGISFYLFVVISGISVLKGCFRNRKRKL